MGHLHAGIVETLCVFLRTAGGGEDDAHTLADEQVNKTVYLRVHQRDVDAPWLVGGLAHLVDVLQQRLGVHRTSPQQA